MLVVFCLMYIEKIGNNQGRKNDLLSKQRSSRRVTDYRRISFLKHSIGPRLQNFQASVERNSSKLTLSEVCLSIAEFHAEG